MKPEAPVPLTSQGHRAGGNEHRHLASNSMTMFGSNAWDRATQHPTDLVGDNLHQGGATRHWVSPYSDPQLEYVYLGTPHQGSPQTSQVASPQRWPMPDATLNPSLAPPASNNVQYFQVNQHQAIQHRASQHRAMPTLTTMDTMQRPPGLRNLVTQCPAAISNYLSFRLCNGSAVFFLRKHMRGLP